jgi:plastocyanin
LRLSSIGFEATAALQCAPRMAPARHHADFLIVAQRGPGDIASSSHSQWAVPVMRHLFPLAVLLSAALAVPAWADDPSFSIVLKNNHFIPSEVQIPSGVKVKLVVKNENQTTSEFESNQFHREKVVGPGQEITVYVGPLDPGSYEFFDDFHPSTRGHLVVK